MPFICSLNITRAWTSLFVTKRELIGRCLKIVWKLPKQNENKYIWEINKIRILSCYVLIYAESKPGHMSQEFQLLNVWKRKRKDKHNIFVFIHHRKENNSIKTWKQNENSGSRISCFGGMRKIRIHVQYTPELWMNKQERECTITTRAIIIIIVTILAEGKKA